MAAAATGVHNLLLLTGDNPKAGDQPDTKPVFDIDSPHADRDGARTAGSRRAAVRPQGRRSRRFFIGAADLPIDPPAGWRPDGLAPKVAAGAQFVQTQFCMDAGVVRRYAAPARRRRASRDLYLLIGIAPLRSAQSAQWMKEHLYGTIIPDALVARLEQRRRPVAEGQRICLELIAEFADIPKVAGVHIMAPDNEAAVPEVIAEARKQMPAPAKV